MRVFLIEILEKNIQSKYYYKKLQIKSHLEFADLYIFCKNVFNFK